jgi:hypothetical protein
MSRSRDGTFVRAFRRKRQPTDNESPQSALLRARGKITSRATPPTTNPASGCQSQAPRTAPTANKALSISCHSSVAASRGVQERSPTERAQRLAKTAHDSQCFAVQTMPPNQPTTSCGGACVGRSWTLRSEHCGHPDRSIVDTEIGVVDSEIAIVNADIGVVDSEIADRV